MPLYDRPVRVLMHEMVDGLGIRPGHEFTRDQAISWFREQYPLVKEGTVAAHLTRLSVNNKNRLHYNARSDGSDDLLVQTDSSHFRLYEAGKDPAPIRANSPSAATTEITDESDDGQSSMFAYERDLREYLARNLQLLEAGLRLYEQEGVSGVEYPAGGRFIDILAVDAASNYVIIELKVSRGYDRVVGQLLRYMGRIASHHADAGQRVRGIIVAKEITEDLKLACMRQSDITLFEYSLAVSVQRVRAQGPSQTI